MSIVTRHGFRPGEVDYYETLPGGYDVGSWCPTPDGSGPMTQVHLLLNMAFGKILMRFKSARELDTMIDALVEHRENVWGKRSQSTK